MDIGQYGKFLMISIVGLGKFSFPILTMENLCFGHGHGQNFDHSTRVLLKFWPFMVKHFWPHHH